MQHKIFLLLAFSLLIAIACSRDQESPQTQQPATTAEPESMMEEVDSDEQVNGQEGDEDNVAPAMPSVDAGTSPDYSGPAPAEVQPACAGLALTPDEPIEKDTWPHQEITAVVWSPDSTKLAVIGGDGAWLYDLIGDEVTRQKLDGEAIKATSVAFNSTSEQMAVGLSDGQIQLWDIDSDELIVQFSGHDAPVQSLAFNPAGTTLASGAGQWYAEFIPRAEGVETRLWDVATGELLGVLAEDMIVPPVSHLAFSPDGIVLAVGQQGHGCASPRCSDGRLRFWQPETNAIAEMAVGHDIAFSDNGRFVAALGQIYESGQVQIWEVETGNKLPSATVVPEGFAFDLALSQDGSTAAVVMGEYGFGGQMANVWDVGTGEELAVVESGAPIALSADGCFLVSSPLSDSVKGQIVTTADDWLRLWDVRQGAELVRLVEVGGSIGQLAFSPDSAWLVATEIDVTGSQLHLIAIPQPLRHQNAVNLGARPSPTPAQALAPPAATAGWFSRHWGRWY